MTQGPCPKGLTSQPERTQSHRLRVWLGPRRAVPLPFPPHPPPRHLLPHFWDLAREEGTLRPGTGSACHAPSQSSRWAQVLSKRLDPGEAAGEPLRCLIGERGRRRSREGWGWGGAEREKNKGSSPGRQRGAELGGQRQRSAEGRSWQSGLGSAPKMQAGSLLPGRLGCAPLP